MPADQAERARHQRRRLYPIRIARYHEIGFDVVAYQIVSDAGAAIALLGEYYDGNRHQGAERVELDIFAGIHVIIGKR